MRSTLRSYDARAGRRGREPVRRAPERDEQRDVGDDRPVTGTTSSRFTQDHGDGRHSPRRPPSTPPCSRPSATPGRASGTEAHHQGQKTQHQTRQRPVPGDLGRSLVNCVVQATPGLGSPPGSAAVTQDVMPQVIMSSGGPNQAEVDFFFALGRNPGRSVNTSFLITAFC